MEQNDLFKNPTANFQELAKQGEVVGCEECEHDVWYPAFILVKVSKLQSKLAKDKIFPIQVYKCANCGHINRSINPLED